MRLYFAMVFRYESYNIGKNNSRFWRSFKKWLGTKVKLSTTFHPQTDGQAEGTIQTVENIIGSYIIEFKGNWDKNLPLHEFSFYNSYHYLYLWLLTKPCMIGHADLQLNCLKLVSRQFGSRFDLYDFGEGLYHNELLENILKPIIVLGR